MKIILGSALSGALFALAVWFLTRYVKQRDDFEKEIKKEISDIPEKIRHTVRDLKDSVSLIRKHQVDLDQHINDFKSNNFSLKEKIQDELILIEKHIIRIETGLVRTQEMAEKLGTTIDRMNERLVFHDKVLTGLAQSAKESRSKLERHDDQIKTVIEKIGKDSVIVKGEKKTSDKG